MSTTVLEREMYSEGEAARLLRLSQSTLHYWLEGGTVRGRTYKPVIRVEPRGTRSVSWAEFVEAGLLAEYRRRHRVPMPELRAFIDQLRSSFEVPYPLAHHRPFVAGRQLVLQAQDDSGLSPEFWLVMGQARGQLLLTYPAEAYLARVQWNDEGIAGAWCPHDDPKSPVRIDPDVRFGRPAISGISTEAIWDQSEGGADSEEIAEMFDLKITEVRWALAYENALNAA